MIGNAVCDLCGDPNAVAYLWIISVKNGDKYDDVSNPADMVATPLDGKTLAVKPETLTGGKTYKFRLESWVKSTKKQVFGFAEYEKEVNKPPEGGSCDVSPKQGFALQPDFKITCSEWVDDTKLIYSVTASVEIGQAELPISPAEPLSLDQSYSLSSETLPVGLAPNEYWINVFITIKDEDDADTKFPVKVQVRPSKCTPFPSPPLLGYSRLWVLSSYEGILRLTRGFQGVATIFQKGGGHTGANLRC